MSGKTVADQLVSNLADAGVRRIYGVVGDSLNPIVDSVRRHPLVDWVQVRNEEVGAFAAGAEAQLTGKLACCAGSCGPGHLHLVNGLYDCHRSGAPVIGIAAHIPSSEIGTYYFQETKPDQIFRECSHYCELISSAKQMPRVAHIAIQEAYNKGGVSVLAISGDVAALSEENEGVEQRGVHTRPAIRPCDEDLDKLAELLNGKGRVTLFCGIGCAEAQAEVLHLAEKLKAAVGHALRGKMFIQPDNPYDVGMSGMLGYGACYAAMHDCDVLVLLGTDFPYDEFLPSKPKIVQIDLRPERLGRRCRVDLGLCGDIGHTLRALLPKLDTKKDSSHLDKHLELHRRLVDKVREYADHVGMGQPMHPEFVAATVSRLAADDAIFTVDTGMSAVWASRYLDAKQNRRLLGSFVHGSMANAMPQAIGAQFAFPDRQVVALCGDGGLTMLLGDLLTLRQYKLPIKLVVFNNSSLGMVKLEQEVAGLVDHGVALDNPDFAALANAIGIEGIRVEDPSLLDTALAQSFAHKGPALIDVVTDPNALSLPPKTEFKQAKGFALAMGKLVLSGHGDEVLDTIKANIRHF